MSGDINMNGTKILYKGPVFSLYSQILLIDTELRNSIPIFRTGSETVAFGIHGVVVAAKGDQSIDVTVCQGENEPAHILCVSGVIQVGNQGLLLGNIPASTITTITWPKGKTLVTIYTDGLFVDITKVIFYLEYLGEE